MPLSHLLNDGHFASLPVERENGEEEDEVWLGEPSAHLNHVVAYHQVVREQMQSILGSLRTQHKQVRLLHYQFRHNKQGINHYLF